MPDNLHLSDMPLTRVIGTSSDNPIVAEYLVAARTEDTPFAQARLPTGHTRGGKKGLGQHPQPQRKARRQGIDPIGSACPSLDHRPLAWTRLAAGGT